MGRKESCPPDGQGLLQFTVKMASPTSPSSPIRRSICYPFPPLSDICQEDNKIFSFAVFDDLFP